MFQMAVGNSNRIKNPWIFFGDLQVFCLHIENLRSSSLKIILMRKTKTETAVIVLTEERRERRSE